MKIEAERPVQSLADWLEWGANELAFLNRSEAFRECEQMLEALGGVSRAELYLSSAPDPAFFPQFSAWVQARKKRVPLAYLLGQAYFWEDTFVVEKGVLIPRPETETVIEAFLTQGRFERTEPFRFLDLGTGSGNIAVTISKLFPKSEGVASDISRKALSVARRNGERLGGGKRIEWVEADGLLAFEKERFDVIFSNPPYVASSDWETLEPEVREEPREALEAGAEGLDFYRRIFDELGCLKRGGSLWLEIGAGERAAVSALFTKKGFREIRTFKDLQQIDRVLCGIHLNG